MGLYKTVFNRYLSKQDAEETHERGLKLLSWIDQSPIIRAMVGKTFIPSRVDKLRTSAFGLSFDHPLGLAAGFDKDARCLYGIRHMGFSFTEVGTITPKFQDGNERPRIWRLSEDKALINRLGFPSNGVEAAIENLEKPLYRDFPIPIGISLGVNKKNATSVQNAKSDYCTVLDRLYEFGDFFVINVSSPNTEMLRELQTKPNLNALVKEVQTRIKTLATDRTPKPLLVKISPDIPRDVSWKALDELLEVVLDNQVDGIIATNTTTSREGLRDSNQNQKGGLSGDPLRKLSTELVKYTYRHTEGKITIVGVGGIFDGKDIWEKMSAGATLVQAYTGFVYEGPMFVKRAIKELTEIMQKEGVENLGDIIGSASV